MLKPAYAERFEIGVSEAGLGELTRLAHRFDELVNRAPNRHAPYVGASAFATKAGIHASAIVKDPRTYEHVPPETIGNRRHVLVSDQAGKANLVSELGRLGLAVAKDDPRLESLLREVKAREAIGYAYEGANASFELLARRMLGGVPDFFDVESFHVNVERRHNALGEEVTVSEAVVKLTVGGERLLTVAEGNGPVNALDRALRKDLGVYRAAIADLELVDYKVRILNGGTEAVTRVLIESSDGSGDSWFTVGVSANIVDASFEALTDSIIYKLVREGVKAA
jgi:2-isopropylmalate synthase